MFFSTLIPAALCAVSVSAALSPPVLHQQNMVDRAEVQLHSSSDSEAGPCGEKPTETTFVNTGACYPLDSRAVSVNPLEDRDCEYHLFTGSSDCDADGSLLTKTSLLAGGEASCVETGIEDEENDEASAMLVCSSTVKPDLKRRQFPGDRNPFGLPPFNPDPFNDDPFPDPFNPDPFGPHEPNNPFGLPPFNPNPFGPHQPNDPFGFPFPPFRPPPPIPTVF
ncbi:hypothetical protein BDY17DRAFT_312348 [Neohortaea acidophila]|uniref:Uncharacterized protein n=1 Tax=Neohortaea acidophila TaxID=245834 RepID=A0A6A6PKK3_9PEZI|nr:uncharacterized protein BDY17DRAFT_312348 [Neohortaea acidophila]KAF2480445.1 hypothetical protein BDY17DRAFT_312348 [Neohortaea acidophila]